MLGLDFIYSLLIKQVKILMSEMVIVQHEYTVYFWTKTNILKQNA